MFCGTCGANVSTGSKFCSRCGEPVETFANKIKSPSKAIYWLIGIPIILLLIVMFSFGIHNWNTSTDTGSSVDAIPTPLTTQEQDLVNTFYGDTSKREFTNAYALLSDTTKKSISYDDLVRSYKYNISESISNIRIDNNLILIDVHREDNGEGGTVYKTYSDTWTATQQINGHITLSDPHSSLLYTTYFHGDGNYPIPLTYEKIKQSLAFVLDGDEHSFIYTGTAFCIGSDENDSYFLTNSHVIPKSATVLYIRPEYGGEQKAVLANVIYRDDDEDLAIVRVNIPAIPVVMLSQGLPKEGQSIAIAGYPAVQVNLAEDGMGLTPSLHTGRINSLTDNNLIIEFDAITDHGNSGGPLFDSSTGVVYGVVSYGLDSNDSPAVQNNFAISMRIVLPFIEDSKVRILTTSTRNN